MSLQMNNMSIRHDIYPARGRKPTDFKPIQWFANLFATIFTPQGDGNWSLLDSKQMYSKIDSPRYLPRKGTETLAQYRELR